jgi:hypothetical protein
LLKGYFQKAVKISIPRNKELKTLNKSQTLRCVAKLIGNNYLYLPNKNLHKYPDCLTSQPAQATKKPTCKVQVG